MLERLLPSLGCLGDSSMVFWGLFFQAHSPIPSFDLLLPKKLIIHLFGSAQKIPRAPSIGVVRRLELEKYLWLLHSMPGRNSLCQEAGLLPGDDPSALVASIMFWSRENTSPRVTRSKKRGSTWIFLHWPMEKWCWEIRGSKQLILRTRP